MDELSDGGDSSDDLDASDEEEMEDLDDSEEAEEVERRVLAEVDEHEERDLQFDDVLKRKNVRRSKCFSHTLQCAINRATKTKYLKFGKVLKKVKTYVKKYRKSPKAKIFLGATSFKKKLIGFVKTRWFSDLAMGRSVIEAFEKPDKPLSVLTEKMSWDIEISVQDIRTLKVFCEILDPFAKHTDILGGENYSTVQLVLPTLLDLFAHLDEMSLKPGMLRFCDKLENEIKKYFAHIIDSNSPDFDPTYIAATYLDPCWTVLLDEDQVEIAKNHLFELCKEYTESENNNEPHDNTEENDTPVSSLAFLNYRYVSKKLTGGTGASGLGGSLRGMFKSDIDMYMKECDRIRHEIQNESKKSSKSTEVAGLEDDVVLMEEEMELNIGASTSTGVGESNSTATVEPRRGGDVPLKSSGIPLKDPLDYWVSEESRYYSPLARVAQDLLTIPATSTPSERLFSASGLLSEGKMSSISPENLEKRVLAKVNLGKF